MVGPVNYFFQLGNYILVHLTLYEISDRNSKRRERASTADHPAIRGLVTSISVYPSGAASD